MISIDDYSAGKVQNLSDLKIYDNRLVQVAADITDKERIEEYFEGVDIVFHQACSKMTVCLKDPRRDLEVNAAGTLNLLELARQHG